MTEFERMMSGKMYDAGSSELAKDRQRAHILSKKYSDTFETDIEERAAIIDELLPNRKGTAFFQGPIFVELGYNISFGNNFWANTNFTAIDNNKIVIGNDVMIGPNCTIATAIHPLCWQDRNMKVQNDGTIYSPEYTRPITIGNNCWIASNVTIIGGVHIGNGCVIGAGSVVTKDIPDNSLAAGVPCKVIRQITEEDRIYNHPEML